MIFKTFFKSASFTAITLALASCGGGGGSSSTPSTSSTPPTTTAPVNSAPVFNSSSEASLAENVVQTFYTLEVSDPDSNPIAKLDMLETPDAAHFIFNPDTGDLSPLAAFDFEAPNDENANNTYQLTFEAEDSLGLSSRFILTVTVTNGVEGFGLSADVPPSENFDLADWKLDTPFNDDGGFDGIQAGVQDYEIAGYEHPVFFHTGPDGGLVMRSPVIGAKTSSGARYTRTELREMLRRGDRSISTRGSGDRPNLNNFAFSSAPQSAQDTAGGVDGRLRVTLAVNSVTTTGENFQIGRLIIGQIHAKDDEPIRLYYRKLPGNTHGSIYAQHEIAGGEDINFDMIGGVSSSQSNPDNGFLLDEVFTYEIIARGNFLDVLILQNETLVAEQTIDMTESGYDVSNDFMYFKAGVYHVNDEADPEEFAQITIYELKNSHEGYAFSE